MLEFIGFVSVDDMIGIGELMVEVGVWFGDIDFVVNLDFSVEIIIIGEGVIFNELVDVLSLLDGVMVWVLDCGDGMFMLGVVSEFGVG